jgi:hypothetical protein
MIGDHHGRTAGSATLLVRAMDGILGTHRLRSDRVMQLPAPPRQPGTMGRPRKHGGELALADLATWPAPQVSTTTVTSRYGTAVAAAWNRVHPRLTHRSAWLDLDDGPLPVIEGTLIRLRWITCPAADTNGANAVR